jgi:Ca-activated chloride channel family protein
MLTVAMAARCYLLVISVCLACSLAWAQTVRVENPAGRTTVQTVMGSQEAEFNVSLKSRARLPDDVKYTETPGMLLVQCQPGDGALIDLDITLPHTATLEVATKTGKIEINGLIRSVDLVSDTGDIKLAAPWELMRLRVVSEQKPAGFTIPKLPGMRFVSQTLGGFWITFDRTADLTPDIPRIRRTPGIPSGLDGVTLAAGPRLCTYGEIRVKAGSPNRVDVLDLPLPDDSWVKPTGLAASILETFPGMRPKEDGGKAAAGLNQLEGEIPAARDGTIVFASQVRLVTLSVPVYDRQGHPIPGLKPADFEVLENGVPQKVALAASEELPFNLVLLLDLSASTVQDREAMKEAARGFIGITRPQDQVAVYALAEGLFQVVSPLTRDRKRVIELLEALPGTANRTPLYNTIVLSYAQEALHLAPDRSALVVISDGQDNVSEGSAGPYGPVVAFEKLRRAVEAMPVLIYPILVPERFANASPSRSPRMQVLADASGGRVFRVNSAQDLAPVYGKVAEELRSVYSIGYYPQNQNFNGKYRRIQVKVKRPGLTLRTRPGYYAW